MVIIGTNTEAVLSALEGIFMSDCVCLIRFDNDAASFSDKTFQVCRWERKEGQVSKMGVVQLRNAETLHSRPTFFFRGRSLYNTSNHSCTHTAAVSVVTLSFRVWKSFCLLNCVTTVHKTSTGY